MQMKRTLGFAVPLVIGPPVGCAMPNNGGTNRSMIFRNKTFVCGMGQTGVCLIIHSLRLPVISDLCAVASLESCEHEDWAQYRKAHGDEKPNNLPVRIHSFRFQNPNQCDHEQHNGRKTKYLPDDDRRAWCTKFHAFKIGGLAVNCKPRSMVGVKKVFIQSIFLYLYRDLKL